MKDLIAAYQLDSVQLQIEDLSAHGAELSEDEIRAVSGGRFAVSWTSGAGHGADEWVRQ